MDFPTPRRRGLAIGWGVTLWDTTNNDFPKIPDPNPQDLWICYLTWKDTLQVWLCEGFWDGKNILHYLGKPTYHRHPDQRNKRVEVREGNLTLAAEGEIGRCCAAGCKDEAGPVARHCVEPLDAGEDPLRTPRSSQPCQHFELAWEDWRFWPSDVHNSEMTNLCCFK